MIGDGSLEIPTAPVPDSNDALEDRGDDAVFAILREHAQLGGGECLVAVTRGQGCDGGILRPWVGERPVASIASNLKGDASSESIDDRTEGIVHAPTLLRDPSPRSCCESREGLAA